MPYYTFNVEAKYRTDPIYAEDEYKARLEALAQLQYEGEELDTYIELDSKEEDID